MKKYLPFTFFALVFTFVVIIQIVSDNSDLKADPANSNEKEAGVYQSAFVNKNKYFDSKGKELVLSKIKSPIVILNFWASWCKPCMVEFPSLSKFSNLYNQDEVKIIGANSDELVDKSKDPKEFNKSMSKINKVLKEYNLNFQNVLTRYKGKENSLLKDFGIEAIPVTIVFHKSKVIHISRGAEDFMGKKFLNKINNYLKK